MPFDPSDHDDQVPQSSPVTRRRGLGAMAAGAGGLLAGGVRSCATRRRRTSRIPEIGTDSCEASDYATIRS